MPSDDGLQLLFWASFAALFYTFLGYPLLIGALAKAFGQPVKKSPPTTPPAVTVVLVAFK